MSAFSPACVARPATLDDLGEIAELLHRLFGGGRTVESLRWKFGGLAGRLAGSAVLTADRRIVGFLGQVPVRAHVMGREIPAAQGSDLGILETHRRLDTFLALVQASLHEMERAGVALAYGVANAEAAATAELLGRKRPAPVPLVVRPLRTDPSLGRGSRIFARVLSACDGWLERRSLANCPAARDRLQLRRVDRFDERFDRFWQEIMDDYPIMLVRDAAHLNWRYVDSPGVAYERICVESAESGRVEGYAVLSLRPQGRLVRGAMADLVTARHAAPGISGRLIRAAIAWFRAQGADIAEAWAFRHTHLRHSLLGRGFLPRRTGGGGLQASALAPGTGMTPAVAEDAKNWFLSMGDSDTV